MMSRGPHPTPHPISWVCSSLRCFRLGSLILKGSQVVVPAGSEERHFLVALGDVLRVMLIWLTWPWVHCSAGGPQWNVLLWGAKPYVYPGSCGVASTPSQPQAESKKGMVHERKAGLSWEERRRDTGQQVTDAAAPTNVWGRMCLRDCPSRRWKLEAWKTLGSWDERGELEPQVGGLGAAVGSQVCLRLIKALIVPLRGIITMGKGCSSKSTGRIKNSQANGARSIECISCSMSHNNFLY